MKLHIMVRKDGLVRLMLYDGLDLQLSEVIASMNARAAYARILDEWDIDSIHARVWCASRGWVNPQHV